MDDEFEPQMSGKSPREIYDVARARWLAATGGSYAGLHGILVGVIASDHPELLVEAARYADQFVSVDRIVEASLGAE